MGRIAMKKNGLHQHRQVPVYQKENKDNHKRNDSVSLTGKLGSDNETEIIHRISPVSEHKNGRYRPCPR
jgi:hypothetical protein